MKHLPKVFRMGMIPLLIVASGCPHTGRPQAEGPAYKVQVREPNPSGRLADVIPPAPPEKGHASVELSGDPLKPPAPTPQANSDQVSKVAQEKALSELKTVGAKINPQPGSELVSINLAQSKAGDEVAGWLAQVRHVQQLDLSGTKITDEGLAKLSALPKLEFVNLAQTGIGDAGVQSLSSLPALKYVVLNGTKVTDKGLALLAKTASLQGVSLIETAVTEAGVKAFQMQRPDCTVIFRDRKTTLITPPAPAPALEKAIAPTESGPALLSQWEPLNSGTESAGSNAPSKWKAKPIGSSIASPQNLAEDPRESFQRAISTHPPAVESARPGDALAIDLEDVAFLKMVSEIYLQREEWAKAVNVLRRALELEPENRGLRYQLGIALGRSGNLDDSFSELRRANGEATAHYNMGIILYENALKQSGEHFQKALVLDPDIAAARTWMRFLEKQDGNPLEIRTEPKIIPAAGFRAAKNPK